MITQNTRAKYLFGFCIQVTGDGHFVRLDPTGTPNWPIARFRGFAAASILGLVGEIVLFGHAGEPELAAEVIKRFAARHNHKPQISWVHTDQTTIGNALDMGSYMRQRNILMEDVVFMTSDYHCKRASRSAHKNDLPAHFDASEDALHLLCKSKREHQRLAETLRRYYTPVDEPGALTQRRTNEDCGVGEMETGSYEPLAKQPAKTQVA